MATAEHTVYQSTSPFEPARIAAAAIYCSDGRYGEHMDEFLHRGLNLPRYDRLAVPGGAACLAGHFVAWREEETLALQLRFLLEIHDVRRVVLIAHQGCAFYSYRLNVHDDDIEKQARADLLQAARRIRTFRPGLEVDTYFARLRDQRVAFERVGPAELMSLLPPTASATLRPAGAPMR